MADESKDGQDTEGEHEQIDDLAVEVREAESVKGGGIANGKTPPPPTPMPSNDFGRLRR